MKLLLLVKLIFKNLRKLNLQNIQLCLLKIVLYLLNIALCLLNTTTKHSMFCNSLFTLCCYELRLKPFYELINGNLKKVKL